MIMEYSNSLLQAKEKALKEAKKRYDKLTKQIKKCRSEYQYEMLCEDLEDAREDVVELQLIIKDLRKQKKLAEVDV